MKSGCTSRSLRTAPPTSDWASSSRVFQPASANLFAATRPFGPAPITTASTSAGSVITLLQSMSKLYASTAAAGLIHPAAESVSTCGRLLLCAKLC